jgi:hypothetical protein
MAKHKFVVIKGRNLFVGIHGLQYEIFDTVTFECKEEQVTDLQRKYVYRKLHTVDNKSNPLSFRRKVYCRRRHILKHDGSIFADRIKLFDHEDGTYYGFIPVECFKF